jgi:ribosomal protein S18 acetylase RimI-like enzyme
MDRYHVDETVIRPAVASDAAAISRLWSRLVAYHQALDADMPGATPDGAVLYSRSLIDRLDDRQTCVLVAEEDGLVIGYVLGVVVDLMPEMFDYEPGGFLADIFVEAEYRGRGIGMALVQVLAEWFRQQGLRHFEWHVAASNTAALEFWKSVGGRDFMIRMRADID